MMRGTTSTRNVVPAIQAAFPVLHRSFLLNRAVFEAARLDLWKTSDCLRELPTRARMPSLDDADEEEADAEEAEEDAGGGAEDGEGRTRRVEPPLAMAGPRRAHRNTDRQKHRQKTLAKFCSHNAQGGDGRTLDP